MDLPFALPTAVAGLTLASLFSVNRYLRGMAGEVRY
ncbi:sulfate transport system permease protein CysT [Klebsiella pneumoniae]|uniref:Sulfate transport system permease protein CysT n=1 Tax=Klebsiella pneumoniae TaxID=573 RepID=A0A378AIE6_KLEPN|nr:sulfate transport system permease protein CysT [Klebsiella pneumoniae]